MTKRQPSVFVVFFTVFIDLIGFGIVLPMLPLYISNLSADSQTCAAIMRGLEHVRLNPALAIGFVIGVVQASYSFMQFLFAPGWGRLSDRVCRRPVLLVSTAGGGAFFWGFPPRGGRVGGEGVWGVPGVPTFS